MNITLYKFSNRRTTDEVGWEEGEGGGGRQGEGKGEIEERKKLFFPNFLKNVYVYLEAQYIIISLFLFDKH